MRNLQNELDWEISQQPIYNANGVVINGYKEITKNKSNSSSLISVMKDSYYPIPVGEFTDIVKQISAETGMEIAGYNEFKKGAIITAQLKSTNDFIIGDSVIEGYLTLGTGFDGSQSFFIGHTNEFLRCQNQFGRIIKNFTSRLTKGNVSRVDSIITQLFEYSNFEKELYASFEKMTTVKIDSGIVKSAVERLIGLTNEERLDNNLINTQKRNKLISLKDCISAECGDLGDNAFGLFNGITKYTTHEMSSRQEDVFGNLFTGKALLNNHGYDLIVNEIIN